MGRDGRGVRKVSESSVEITFTFKGVRCRETIKIEPTAAGLKRAERHRAVILDAIEKGCFDYAVTFPTSPRRLIFSDFTGDVQTVAAYLDNWLMQESLHLKASTAKDYSNSVNIWIAAFGKLMLSELKRPLLRDWCRDYPASNKRITNLLSVLRIALKQAVDDELIQSNPLHDWTFRKKENCPDESERTAIDPFTTAEREQILAVLDGQARNLVKFAFWTGLRTSELVALRWSDVDFSGRVVHVQRAFTQAASVHEVTKTISSNRDVRLLDPALDALTQQKEFTFTVGDIVFQNPRTNEPWSGDQAIRKTLWIPALEKAGVNYRYPYQTRHTFASMMLSGGENPMWVAKMMGHADWSMIRRRYGKWIPDVIDLAGNKAVAMFASPIKPSESESE